MTQERFTIDGTTLPGAIPGTILHTADGYSFMVPDARDARIITQAARTLEILRKLEASAFEVYGLAIGDMQCLGCDADHPGKSSYTLNDAQHDQDCVVNALASDITAARLMIAILDRLT